MKWGVTFVNRAGVAAILAVLCLAPAASADKTEETQFQDDTLLVYPSASAVAGTLDTLKSLGVDRIRVSVYWRLVAPDPDSRTPPDFPHGASDPASYPPDSWLRYDNIVRLAAERGIGVNFNVTGSAPDWADEVSPDAEVDQVYYPSPGAFGSFVQAVGTRYSGSYVPTVAPTKPIKKGIKIGGVTIPGITGATGTTDVTPAPTGPPLPRVSFWSIWNEPNQSHFLAPQWRDANVPGGRAEAAPKIYRQLVDASARALTATGHLHDTILIGETAPKGQPPSSRLLKSSEPPLRFIRRLYCMDDNLHFLRGNYAKALGCPTSNQKADFVKAHPALFYATGYAHHPYALLTAPQVRSQNTPAERDYIALADLDRLTSAMATIRSRYGFTGTLPIYFTEFGYQSDPPDPFAGFSEAGQAAAINESEFLAYSNPFVRSFHQFLLRDSAPTDSPISYVRWSTFQTGIETLSGRPKLAYAAFRIPIWIPGASRGSGGSFRVWGILRPARNGSSQTAAIQFKPRSGGGFTTVKTVKVTNLRNVVDTRVNLTRSGAVRILWRGLASRSAPVTIAG
jgi:hypothetical protein